MFNNLTRIFARNELKFFWSSVRYLNVIPHDSLLWKHFEYVRRKGEEPKFLSSKNLHLLLQHLDRTFENPSVQDTVTTETYIDAMAKFPTILKKSFASKEQLIKMLFYVGLQKKTNQSQILTNSLLNSMQKYHDLLTLEDVCILASTVFKCSVPRMNASTSALVSATIHANFEHLLQNPIQLVCLIKTLRQQRQLDYDLLQKMADNSSVWMSYLTVNRAHILCYFAEAKFCPDNFPEMFLKFIKDCDEGMVYRDKDLARILWVASVMGAEISKEDADVIWNILKKKMDQRKMRPEFLLDSLLSMASLGHFSEDLTRGVVNPKTIQRFINSNKMIPWVRMRILMQILKIEHNQVFEVQYPQLPDVLPDSQILVRPDLKKVLFVAKCFAPKMQLTSVKSSFNVPVILDAGIEVTRNNKTLHIEVLDNYSHLYKSNQLTGISKLKLRLLQRLQSNLLIVNQEDLELGDSEFSDWLGKKLSTLLC